MSGKKCCNTINLAKVSIDSLKKCPPQIEGPKKPNLDVKIPPSPRVVKRPQILLCKPRPVEFKYPGAPCLCPPCPVCPTWGDRVKGAVFLSMKLLGVVIIGKMTIDEGLWGSPDLTSRLAYDLSSWVKKLAGEDDGSSGKCEAGQGVCRMCVEEQFCATGGASVGLSSILDAVINVWNLMVTTLFYSTIGFASNARHQAEAHVYYVLSGQQRKDREKAKMLEEEEKKKKLEESSQESEHENSQKQNKFPRN